MEQTLNMAIDPDYEKAREFSENGLAVVCMDGKFGVIDRYGNRVAKTEYNDIQDFDDTGYTIVQKNGKYGIMNAKGKITAKIQYQAIGAISAIN